jgi:hypothetical protein
VLNGKRSGRERRSKSASERSGIQARPVVTNLDGVTGMVAIVRKEEEEEEVEEEAVEATDLLDILQSPSVYTDEEVGHPGILWRHAFDSPPYKLYEEAPGHQSSTGVQLQHRSGGRGKMQDYNKMDVAAMLND